MKEIKININKNVVMTFYNFYFEVYRIFCNVRIELHSYYNPYESMLFEFIRRRTVVCGFDGLAYQSIYWQCRRFYTSTLKKMDDWRKKKIYRDMLSAFLVNDSSVEIVSPIKVHATFETKY